VKEKDLNLYFTPEQGKKPPTQEGKVGDENIARKGCGTDNSRLAVSSVEKAEPAKLRQALCDDLITELYKSQ
jgi:hypothetical protein